MSQEAIQDNPQAINKVPDVLIGTIGDAKHLFITLHTQTAYPNLLSAIVSTLNRQLIPVPFKLNNLSIANLNPANRWNDLVEKQGDKVPTFEEIDDLGTQGKLFFVFEIIRAYYADHEAMNEIFEMLVKKYPKSHIVVLVHSSWGSDPVGFECIDETHVGRFAPREPVFITDFKDEAYWKSPESHGVYAGWSKGSYKNNPEFRDFASWDGSEWRFFNGCRETSWRPWHFRPVRKIRWEGE